MYTKLETEVLTAMVQDHFVSESFAGKEHTEYLLGWEDCALDTVTIITGIKGKQLSGIMSSLTKKGVVSSNDDVIVVIYALLPQEVKDWLDRKND